MKVNLEVERTHYKAKLEFSDEETDQLENRIEETLRILDNAIQNSSKVWHASVPIFLKPFLDILPNGSARFHPGASSQIEQVILITAVGGKRGISASEASRLLDLPTNSVTGYYQQEAYENLFKGSESGGFKLSTDGLERLRQIQERLSTEV